MFTKHGPLTNLRNIRLKLGMNQSDFGDMIGFERSGKNQQSYYRKYETGELQLSAVQAHTILHTFTLTLKQLIS